MSKYVQIVTTTAERADAQRIAKELIERRLAACVQIVGPIESTYRWENKVETASEWQCWIKTKADLFTEVDQAIHQIHPYQVPEILALPILAGSAGYLRWLEDEVRQV